jgi:hypothetical protein
VIHCLSCALQCRGNYHPLDVALLQESLLNIELLSGQRSTPIRGVPRRSEQRTNDGVLNLAAKRRQSVSAAARGSENPFWVGVWWVNRTVVNVGRNASLFVQALRVVGKSIRQAARSRIVDRRQRTAPSCPTHEAHTIAQPLPNKTICNPLWVPTGRVTFHHPVCDS